MQMPNNMKTVASYKRVAENNNKPVWKRTAPDIHDSERVLESQNAITGYVTSRDHCRRTLLQYSDDVTATRRRILLSPRTCVLQTVVSLVLEPK